MLSALQSMPVEEINAGENDNIDQMLMERHLSKKARRSSKKNHIKGLKKRTEEDDINFRQSFEKMIMEAQGMERVN